VDFLFIIGLGIFLTAGPSEFFIPLLKLVGLAPEPLVVFDVAAYAREKGRERIFDDDGHMTTR
jgi:hypothetical protein